MSRTSQILFLVFVWLALVYVIIAFTDITAPGLRQRDGPDRLRPRRGRQLRLYLVLGLAMGVLLCRFRTSLTWTTAVFIRSCCW